jgi:HlyD family secretion protein
MRNPFASSGIGGRVFDLVGVQPDRAPPLGRVAWAGNFLLFGFVLGFAIWSVFAPLESAAIASGVLETESSRKTIQHLEGGIVRDILVREGDIVTVGQPLIRLDSTRPRAEVQSLRGQFWEARAREARLLAERDGKEVLSFSDEFEAATQENTSLIDSMAGQQEIFQARRQVLRSQLALVREKIAQVEKEIIGLTAQKVAAAKRADIARQEFAAVSTLVEKGLERRPRLLALEREMTEIDGRAGELAAQISRAHQVISEAQAMLIKLKNDQQNEIVQSLREAQSQIFQLGERIQSVADQLSRTEVKAPEPGIITELRVHTPGGVIGPGTPMMDLVPRHDRLIVIARLRPEDIDVVHLGLHADIHLLPYNQRRVPPLKGEVSYVSADRMLDKRTDQPYYTAKIRIADERVAALKDVALMPGMPTQVFIKTGRSTVAVYALRPLLDSFNGAFRED